MDRRDTRGKRASPGDRRGTGPLGRAAAAFAGEICLLLLVSCRPSAPRPALPPRLWRVRNLARLQFERSTASGFREAAKLFADAAELSSGDPDDLLNRARALLFCGTDEAGPEARRIVERLLEKHGESERGPTLRYLAGLGAKRTGDPEEAARRFAEVVEREPESAAAHYQLGAALFAAGRAAEALEPLWRAARLDRSWIGAAALFKAHQALRLEGRREEADATFARFQARQRALPKGNPGEEVYERCRHTAVRLVPALRRDTEPPPARLSLRELAAWPAAAGTETLTVDLDGDGRLDRVELAGGRVSILRQRPSAGASLSAETGAAPRFEDITGASDLPDGSGASATGAAAGGADNDGLVDLYLYGGDPAGMVARNMGEGVLEPAPVLEAPPALAARWVDYDHDGDLDPILLARAGGPEAERWQGRVVRNNGDGTFLTPGGEASGGEVVFPGPFPPAPLPPGGRPGFAFADFDLASDIDFAFPSAEGAILYLNRRRGAFRREVIEELAGSPRLVAADLDNDGDPDLAGLPGPGVPLRIAWNDGVADEAPSGDAGPRMPHFRVESLSSPETLGAALDGELADLDDDGDLDLVLVTDRGLRLLSAREGRRFEDVPLDLPAGFAPRRARAADLDGDGHLDLLLSGTGSGSGKSGRGSLVRLFSLQGRDDRQVLRLQLVGARDNRLGIGALVELHAGKHYQQLLVSDPQGARFGLGTRRIEDVDGARVLWPNGISQAVLAEELRAGDRGAVTITQKEGLMVSCPFLFAYDGQRYRFLTDVVAIAPIDEWLPAGESSTLDPEEYVRIAGPALAAHPPGGGPRLAITEELRETTYLDRVELIEVRHDAGIELWGRESTRQGRFDPLEVLVVRSGDRVPPRSVRPLAAGSSEERAASANRAAGPEEARLLTRRADGRYLRAFAPSPPHRLGWSHPYAIEIEGAEPIRAMLLRGRVIWPDSDARFALAQEGASWIAPRIEAPTAPGRWRPVVEDAGLPCGMDRDMVVDLPAGAGGFRRLRLLTSYPILWDRISLIGAGRWVRLETDGAREVAAEAQTVRLERVTLPLVSARLRSRGFSRVWGRRARHEESYRWESPDPGGIDGLSFARPSGLATRLGPVRELLERRDDRFAILVPGDAVELRFAPPDPLPAERERTWFLRITGWAKEASFHNSTGRWIAPLPGLNMKEYPPRRGGAIGPDGPGRIDETERDDGTRLERWVAR